jgi:hypothetical protein
MCQTSESPPGPLSLWNSAIPILRRPIPTELEIQIGTNQSTFIAVINRRHRSQRRLDVRELVQLERYIRFQQIKIARVNKERYCPVDRARDGAEPRRIAGKGCSLIETINISGNPLRTGWLILRLDTAGLAISCSISRISVA